MRDLPASAIAALASGKFGKRTFIRIDMPDGVVGYCDDNQSYVDEGVTYHGKPGLFQVRLPASTSDGSVPGVEVIISGLDADVAGQVEDEAYHQRPISIGVLIYDPADPQIGEIYWWYTGFIDQIPRQERVNGECRLLVKVEGHNRDFDRGSSRTRSDADQRLRDAGDTFFAFVAQAKTTEMRWGPTVQQVQPKPSRGFLDWLF